MDAKQVISVLGLEPLPHEGGYYRETFRDQGLIARSALPTHQGDRAFTTCIYYLVTAEAFSALHVVESTEVFHFYLGDPVRMIQLDGEGQLTQLTIGVDLHAGQRPQAVVPAGVWQGCKLVDGGRWALLGCQVSPGFEFEDFRVETYENLAQMFPAHEALVRQFTHR